MNRNLGLSWVIVTIFFTMTGCLPAHLAQLQGKTSLAKLSKSSHTRLVLRDIVGEFFEIDSSLVSVSFEIKRLGASEIRVTDHGHTALFRVPKSILNHKTRVLFVPSERSGQPYNLEINEFSRVLKSWSRYREDEVPIYQPSCTSGGGVSPSCTTVLVGFDFDYYLDHLGVVERSVSLRLSSSGEPNVAEIMVQVSQAEELIESDRVTPVEFASHQHRH